MNHELPALTYNKVPALTYDEPDDRNEIKLFDDVLNANETLAVVPLPIKSDNTLQPMEIDLAPSRISSLLPPFPKIPILIGETDNFLPDLSPATITLPADITLPVLGFNISKPNLLAIENTHERRLALKRKSNENIIVKSNKYSKLNNGLEITQVIGNFVEIMALDRFILEIDY